MGKYIGCAGAGRDRFVIKKLHIERSFPGTGDLYGAVLILSLIHIYVLTKDEGGRHTPFFSNYRPQFYFRTTDRCV